MNAEKMVERYFAEKVKARDDELRRRLEKERSTEEMLFAFSRLKGLNVEERERARAKYSVA